MGRLARYTLNSLTALSLLLCVATVCEAVRSLFVIDALLWMSSDRRTGGYLVTDCGGVSYLSMADDEGTVSLKGAQGAGLHWVTSSPSESYYPNLKGFTNTHRFAGFEWAAERFASGGASSVTLPLPCIALLLAAPGGFRLWRRLRRRIPGLCPRCFYNLTGNVSGVCPECGTPAAANSGGAVGKHHASQEV